MDWTIWNELDDEGNPLIEGKCYAVYPPAKEIPGAEDAFDAVQLFGVVCWYVWDDKAGLWTFCDEDGERLDLGNVDYAKRQS